MGINIGLDIQRLYALGLLDRLLKDKTTGHNILWATDAYSALGMRYGYDEPLSPALITGSNAEVIQARAQKGQARRDKRTRQHGEVCTPLWVVKKMIDHADEVWFGAPDRFFVGEEPTLRVQFDRENDWQRYVDSRRLEITCGEAPYLVTRYDVETGEEIPLPRRIGILDRKLRAVNENAADAEWLYWVTRAFEACYGYELQGDSLLTARVNLLMTFEEYYRAKWNARPPRELYRYILNRIVWNIWQMDGLTGTLPCAEESDPRFSLADFADTGVGEAAPPIPPPRCRIYDWRRKRSLEYLNMQGNEAKTMKFDYILGNPPYQDETLGDNKGFAPPIYHLFMNETYKIADCVELIHPARFLFNAGSTPKAWNQKMLSDPHLNVVYFESDGSKVFPNTEIKGGIAITCHDTTKEYGAIGTFTAFPELSSIMKKAAPENESDSLITIIFVQNRFDLEALYSQYPKYRFVIGSDGKDKRFRNNIFEKIPLFTEDKRNENEIRVLGVINNKRVWRYFPMEFTELGHENIRMWKVLVPRVSGAGTFGDVLSKPLIAEPFVGYTQTFIGIGAFESKDDANACLKYIKSKFARAMLGILKITQDNNRETWRYVPLQDLTPASDIDWSQPIPAIDRQLYAKYGLDEQEIAFIESHVKEME